MNEWIERNKGYLFVLLASVIINGTLVLSLHRPSPAGIKVVPPAPTETPARLRIFVSGAVVAPDVYELLPGSLVRDAVEMAGGATGEADLSQVNLARQLRDQEQVHVPYRPAPGMEPAPSGPLSGRVNLNIATAKELETLPGIGPALAERIVQLRAERGPFAALDELQQVPGIGEALCEQLKDRVVIE